MRTLVILENRPVANDEALGALVVLEQHPFGRVIRAPSQWCQHGELPHSLQSPRLLNLS